MPAAAEMYDQLEPVYEDVSGWSEKIDGAKTFEQLPRAAQVISLEIVISSHALTF